jgi:type II secretory pathway pseudopilin PulG
MLNNPSASSGQALLEVLIAMVMVVLVATAFVTLGASSVRNSTFSKQQATATKLAQEGIEAMITVRDQNGPGAIEGVSPNGQWIDLFAAGAIASCPTPGDVNAAGCSDFILKTGTCSLVGRTEFGATPTLVDQRCIQKNSNPEDLTVDKTPYTRKIRVVDPTDAGSDPSRIKDVSVFVSWSDSIGVHTAVVSRKIGKGGFD